MILQLRYILEEKVRVDRAKSFSAMEKYSIPEITNEEEWQYLTGQSPSAPMFASTGVSAVGSTMCSVPTCAPQIESRI